MDDPLGGLRLAVERAEGHHTQMLAAFSTWHELAELVQGPRWDWHLLEAPPLSTDTWADTIARALVSASDFTREYWQFALAQHGFLVKPMARLSQMLKPGVLCDACLAATDQVRATGPVPLPAADRRLLAIHAMLDALRQQITDGRALATFDELLVAPPRPGEGVTLYRDAAGTPRTQRYLAPPMVRTA